MTPRLTIGLFALLIIAQASLAGLNQSPPATGGGGGGGDMVSTNNLSDLANKGTSRTNLGVAIGTNVEAFDADLDYLATFTPSANVKTILNAADFAAVKTALGLTIGTNVQAFDADLDYLATFTPSANVKTLLNAADFAAVRTALSLTIGTNVQAWDADLDYLAGFTPSANVKALLNAADYAAVKSLLSLNLVENTALSTWAGSTSLTTGGTFTTGAWNATIGTGATYSTDNTAVPNNGGGWTEYFVTSSNATTTGQALVDITGLVSGTLSNSTKYEIEVNLDCVSSADTNGNKYGISGGGTGSAAVVQVAAWANSTNSTTISQFSFAAPDTANTNAVMVTSGQTGQVVMKGFVTTRSTGTATISIQHLKVTTGTSTVKVGSILRIRKAHT